MAAEDPSQDPELPQDARLGSLDERLRQAQHEEAVRTGKAPRADANEQLGQRVLSTLIGGLLGFVGPLVFGNGDHLVNIHAGKLLGISSINGPHALLHVAMGLWGILAARASHRAALANIVATVLLWGALTVSYLLLADKNAPQLFILGMPVDNGATVVHLIWAGLAIILLAQPLFRRGGKVVLPEDSEDA